MNRFDLPLMVGTPAILRTESPHVCQCHDPHDQLLANLRWYCQLRWIVVLIVTAYALTSISFSGCFQRIGLVAPVYWPLHLAGLLVLANLGYLAHIRRITKPEDSRPGRMNLWVQIVTDLILMSIAVHIAGSQETHIAFSYVIHIALACIFLPRQQSFVVTMIALVLYTAVITLEISGILPRSSVFITPARMPDRVHDSFPIQFLQTASVSVFWILLWFLASHLSTLTRWRECELERSNQDLQALQKNRQEHMLRMTHELKAPFAAIQANAQLLLGGYCGELSEKALELTSRTYQRCSKMSWMIQEMLQLANLETAAQKPMPAESIEIAECLRWCVTHVRQIADQRHIHIQEEIEACRTWGQVEHLKVLFNNLIVNAIVYSHENGAVEISCRYGENGAPVVVIRDHGIGIPGDKLPRIFEEYFRTDEAVKHNKDSTGLGLAIAKRVVETHGIRLSVESAIGEGTVFTLVLPAKPTEENNWRIGSQQS